MAETLVDIEADVPESAASPVATVSLKLLVVDDQPEVCSLLEEFFSARGYEVERALGGLEALAKIEKNPPAMVLLDVRMPDLDGIEVLRKIREAGPRPPVLMMSGNDDVTVAKRTIELGAVDYVLKPFDFDNIDRIVHKTLSESGAGPESGEPAPPALPEPSAHGLLYDLSLEIFQTTRQFRPEARGVLGTALENVALSVMQKGNSYEKQDLIKALFQLRMLTRFARDLGDLSDEQHRRLEAHLVRARRANGLN